jgi:patatin-like phospholipase/acyl hydrolase
MSRGGIRGIVILEVLRQIELELGKRIPIQDFFDLIVGTRLVVFFAHIFLVFGFYIVS